MSRRVVITGIGAVTPIGTGSKGLWQGVLREKSAVAKIKQFDPTPFNCHVAAEVTDFQPENYLDHKRLKRLDRFSRFAVVAGLLAMEDACLTAAELDPDRAGVCLGSALGGIGMAEEEIH